MDTAAYLEASARAAASLASRPGPLALDVAAKVIADAIADGGKVLLCGNGGSAADAQHLAAELVGELGLGLHRSGNVVLGAAAAMAKGMTVLALLGPDEGTELDEHASIAMHVEGATTGIVQQGHITLGHALCARVERLLDTAGD